MFMNPRRIIIMGAAGRDFHNFNIYFRDNKNYQVVAFTATQIPNIEGRSYPPALSGDLYPEGIPIYPEDQLASLIQKEKIDEVVFAYSDISYDYVMHRASLVMSAGADFKYMGLKTTQLESKVPVIAVCAVRTGCGKSQTTRRIGQILRSKGKHVVVVRHPMPYGDLTKQRVQRFERYVDLDAHHCTIEEREEYEPHLDMGNIVYAGIDYQDILQKAEEEADLILWDGGNNDMPFFKPSLLIVVVDPHRPGHELSYFPGEINFRTADVVIINKIKTATEENIGLIKKNIQNTNPKAVVIEAASPLTVSDPEKIRGKRALIIEDGPTLTHGGMKFGAGYIAAQENGVSEIVDPRLWVRGSITKIYDKYPDIGKLLPAMGYDKVQIQDLEETINAVDCEVVIIGTPIDLTKIITINKPAVRVQYHLEEIGKTTLEDVLKSF
jgi:predicted GTPase